MAITPAQLEALALKPDSVSGDAGSVKSRSADDILKLTAAAADLDETANVNGGSRSAFNFLRPARATFPGAYR